MLELSPRAVDVIAKAETAARRFNASARVRVFRQGLGVAFELADQPEAGDAILEHPAGFTVFVETGLSGIVDVEEPHDRLVLRVANGQDHPPAPGLHHRSIGSHG